MLTKKAKALEAFFSIAQCVKHLSYSQWDISAIDEQTYITSQQGERQRN